jgi:hypothetical protein
VTLFLLTHHLLWLSSFLSLPSFLHQIFLYLAIRARPPPVDLITLPASLVLNITNSFSVQFHVFRPNSGKVEISTNLGFWDSFSTFNGRPNLLFFLFWNFLLFFNLFLYFEILEFVYCKGLFKWKTQIPLLQYICVWYIKKKLLTLFLLQVLTLSIWVVLKFILTHKDEYVCKLQTIWHK